MYCAFMAVLENLYLEFLELFNLRCTFLSCLNLAKKNRLCTFPFSAIYVLYILIKVIKRSETH